MNKGHKDGQKSNGGGWVNVEWVKVEQLVVGCSLEKKAIQVLGWLMPGGRVFQPTVVEKVRGGDWLGDLRMGIGQDFNFKKVFKQSPT